MKEKTLELLNFVKEHGGRVATTEAAEALGVKINSITPRVTNLVNGGFAFREKVTVEGQEKPVTFVELTEEGMNYVPSEDEVEA